MKPKEPGIPMELTKYVGEVAKTRENPMAGAATYEQLLSCWEDLKKRLDTSYKQQLGDIFLKNLFIKMFLVGFKKQGI